MNYLLETGVEEIPAGFLPLARKALEASASGILNEMAAGMLGGALKMHVWTTPRRLALFIENLPLKTEDQRAKHKGPPVRAAFDASGKPTKAAEGFAKKVGISVDEIKREGDYIVAEVTVKGQSIETVLTGAVPRIIGGIQWPKSMRWDSSGVRFVRAVRWIVSLLDADELPVNWGELKSSRNSRVRRQVKGNVSDSIAIPNANSYLETLRGRNVFADHKERTEMIERDIRAAASKLGGEPVFVGGKDTFTYLADLVEDPVVLAGSFDAVYTQVPREVLELTMWRHQKYIPLQKNGALLPHFLLTANRAFGEPNDPGEFESNVRAGNQRVLSARLSDAKFFWNADTDRNLIERLDDLARVTYQKDAGSILDRVHRIAMIAERIAPKLGIQNSDDVREAANLAKADLTTKMVFEFPELQGIIGRRVAEHFGCRAEIARSIEEHYWPLGADPRVPTGLSAVIALAEKADTLITIFGVGLEPTGSADPFGLRRAAIGIIRILAESGEKLGVTEIISDEKVLAFLRGRLLNFAIERSGGAREVNAAVVEAVLASGWDSIPDFFRRLDAARRLSGRADFADIKSSFKRVMNILKEEGSGRGTLSEALLKEDAERALWEASKELERRVAESLRAGKIDDALAAMAAVRPAVDLFFDKVLVNAPDEELKANRKTLLRELAAIFLRVMDFSKL